MNEWIVASVGGSLQLLILWAMTAISTLTFHNCSLTASHYLHFLDIRVSKLLLNDSGHGFLVYTWEQQFSTLVCSELKSFLSNLLLIMVERPKFAKDMLFLLIKVKFINSEMHTFWDFTNAYPLDYHANKQYISITPENCLLPIFGQPTTPTDNLCSDFLPTITEI